MLPVTLQVSGFKNLTVLKIGVSAKNVFINYFLITYCVYKNNRKIGLRSRCFFNFGSWCSEYLPNLQQSKSILK